MLKFPTPASITKYRQDTFVKRAWEIVGRKVSKHHLLIDIYQTAQQSIGLTVPADGVAIETFKLQLNRFYKLNQQRVALEKQADSFLSARADYQHLKTIPDVGPIIAESGDLARFGHYRQYLNYCGFNLSTIQSGNRKGQYYLSKRGNSRLRYAFCNAGDHFKLGCLVNGVDVIDPLLLALITLVDGVDADVTRFTVRPGFAPLTDV